MLVSEIVDRTAPAVPEATSLNGFVSILKTTDRTTLAVVNERTTLVGIISLHDLIKHFFPQYIDLIPSLDFLGKAEVLEHHLLSQIVDPETSQLFLVHDVMTGDIIAVHEHDSTFKALALMVHKKYHHLPVVGDGMKYIGMIDQRSIIMGLLSPPL
ncbi:CBS domain-containing protein [candidate division WOR-3 bacterium]|nr:CBS domain-containing protein [candidate division WOR-3 bacterium]